MPEKMKISLFTGHLMWYRKLWSLTPLIVAVIIVGCLIAVIILICIIICMCRQRRKRSGKSKNTLMPLQNHKNKSSLTFVPFFLLLKLSQAWKNHWWIISRMIPTLSHVKIMKIYRSMVCKILRPR